MTTELAVRVEDKLFYNRYLVDPGRAHIKVRPHTVPSPALLTLLKVCPARCYELNDKGQVEITVDGTTLPQVVDLSKIPVDARVGR